MPWLLVSEVSFAFLISYPAGGRGRRAPRSECLSSLYLGVIAQVHLLSVRGGHPAHHAVCNLVEQKRDGVKWHHL